MYLVVLGRSTFFNFVSFLYAYIWGPKATIAPCNEHGIIYAISIDFGDCMTTQSLGLTSLLSESLGPKNILKRISKAKHEERTQRNAELDEFY